MSKSKKKIVKGAICITCGEQSENHAGMVKQGNGLAEHGFSIEKMRAIQAKFEEMGGETEWVDCKSALDGECKYTEDAGILVMRDCVGIMLEKNYMEKIKEMQQRDGWTDEEVEMVKIKMKEKAGAKAMWKELNKFEWDKTYWDVRRQKWLNKHARFNVCFGEEAAELDKEKKSGTIIAYDACPLLKAWKIGMEEMCNEEHMEAEGNLYYDVDKTGIGFHGDGERKKIVAANLCDDDVERELNWQWFEDSKPIGKRLRVVLRNGDGYIMSEKASGFDWKKKVAIIELEDEIIKVKKKTLRHAAGVTGSKYLKIKGQEEVVYV